MRSRTLVTLAALSGLALAAAPAAHAGQTDATAPVDHPLSTSWLSATPLLPESTEAPACRPDDPARRASRASTAAKIAQVRTLLAAEAAHAPEGDGDFRVLNSRGYNYGGNAVVDPSLIEFEARRQLR
jgi:hypothetical protein